MDGITIYNFPAQPPRWDRVGIFYVTFAAVWTTIVASGMIFCLWNRHIPSLRFRCLPLAFSGILLLHLYWCMAQIVYPVGGTMPVVIAYEVQYFIMGMWLPLGIALFHAANLRFLRVAELQKQFESKHSVVRMSAGEGRRMSRAGWMARWHSIKHDNKVFVFIGVGMVFQCILCVGMWAAVAKYHPSFGVAGSEITGETLPEQMIDLGRGWEWWPSVVWQFVWTWMVAPFLIWRAWDIRDTLGWRTQTIGACLSGLHATPMFLIASYASIFYTSGINSYFPPSQWIHLNTMFIEIFTIFIPAYQVIKHWRLQRLAAKRSTWDSDASLSTTTPSRRPSEASAGKSSTIELVDRNASAHSPAGSGDRLFTMGALTRVLSENAAPLQDFSARCDFSGENIAFLVRLAAWKEAFSAAIDASATDPPATAEKRKQAFTAALEIYISFVSPRDADFPLNLSSPQLRALESVFEDAARAVCGTPAFEPGLPLFEHPAQVTTPTKTADPGPPPASTGWDVVYTGAVPAGFHGNVFEDARSHVLNLVLTNTWPKFVRNVLERRGSGESERSDHSDGTDYSGRTGYSGTTVGSWGRGGGRVERFVRGLRS